MNWENYYQAPEQGLWHGREDTPAASCFFQIIKFLDLRQTLVFESETPRFALLGFCCDEGIRRNFGRIGAAHGPTAIRSCFARLPVQRRVAIYDAGNIACVNQDLEGAQQALATAVSLLLQHGMTPIVLGGGHELAWGHYQGIASTWPDKQLGIVNFDAHYDMRPFTHPQDGNSGTPFLQIAQAVRKAGHRFDYRCIGIQAAGNILPLCNTASEYFVKTIYADDLQENSSQVCGQLIEDVVQQNDLLYLSLCLDVFATPYAPGVSAPQALGLTPWQVIPHFRKLASSGKVISYDIAELSPKYDQDDRTAKLAANFVYEIIHHHTST